MSASFFILKFILNFTMYSGVSVDKSEEEEEEQGFSQDENIHAMHAKPLAGMCDFRDYGITAMITEIATFFMQSRK